MSIRILLGRQDPELIGDAGPNRLQPGPLGGYVYGLGGDDTFSIRDGVDAFFAGGSGNDSYTYANNAVTYIFESGNSSNDVFVDRFDLIFSELSFIEIDDRHLVIVGSGSSSESTVVIFDWELNSNRIERWQLGANNTVSFDEFRSAVLASEDYLGSLTADTAFGIQTANEFRRVFNQLTLNARDYEQGAAQTPVLRISEARVNEGDAQTQVLTFNISLSEAATSDVSFRLSTVDNTALSGLDYDAVDRFVTIPRGQSSITATVNVRGDVLREGTENFLIAASDIRGARPDTGLPIAFAFGIIEDNETGTLATLQISNVSVTEGASSFVRFIVRLSSPLANDVTFNARTEAATALPGADYAHVSQAVTIRAGMTSAIIDVPVRSDITGESDEAFRLVLSRPQGAIFANLEAELSATAIIGDDDRRSLPNDTLFSQQYYLLNTGQSAGRPGADLNLMPLVGQYTGRGVNVLVVDEGIDYTHRDFLGAFNNSTDRGVTPPFDDALPRSDNAHGTVVAGIIGARAGDGFGVAGVAPQSQLHGFRLDFGVARDFFADMTASFVQAAFYDVANYSLGFAAPFADSVFNPSTNNMLSALLAAVSDGRNGLGTVVVFAAGNSFDEGSDVNLYGLQSSINVITVAALDRNFTFADTRSENGYSTSGAAILVSAPGTGIISTDIVGSRGYSLTDHTLGQGTSYAAPMVAGVVALMLEANPRLGFRDIQEILALTARQNDLDDGDWGFNAAGMFNGGGAHFNTNYGFGAVDAHAAVRLAETWNSLSQTIANRVITSLPFTGGPIEASGSRFAVRVNDPIDLQHVRVQLDFSFTRFSDIAVSLISPSGTVSELLFRPTGGDITSISQSMQLTSVHFWGESPVGEWQMVIRDRGTNPAADTGVLRSANLVLVGSQANANDVYVYTDEFTNLALTDLGRRTLDDADGLTTLNLAAMTTPSIVNLATGQATLGSTPVSITARTSVSTIFAGDGDDQLTGSDRADTLFGGRGNDTIAGGLGVDTALIGSARANATVTTANNGAVVITSGVGTDVHTGIELFEFLDGTFSFAFSDPGSPRVANFAVGAGGWSSQDRFPRQIADVNGDGFGDIVGFGQAGTLVALGSASGTFAAPVMAATNFGVNQGWSSGNVFHREMADVNNDGRADIVGFGTNGVLVALAQANGVYAALTLGSSNFNPSNGWSSQDSFARTLADVNGDGLADIIGFGVPGTFVALGQGNGSFGAATFALGNFGANQGWTSGNIFHRELGDVNGDGRADIVGFGTFGTLVALGQTNGGFAAPSLVLNNFGTNQGWSTQDVFTRDLADVNGDGRDDVVGFGLAGTFVAYGQADGTFSAAAFDLANFGRNQGWTSDNIFHREIADVNGDGRADIVGFGQSGVFVGVAFDGQVI